MQYMFGILIVIAISFYVGAEVGKWLKRRNTKKPKKLSEEEFHTQQQKDFYKGGMDYKGRKTRQDWQDWYNNQGEDILKNKS